MYISWIIKCLACNEDLQDFQYRVLLPEFVYCHSLHIISYGNSDAFLHPSKNDFFAKCAPVLPVSSSRAIFSSKIIPYMFTSSSLSPRHFYPSLYLSFHNAFQKIVSTQHVTNPVNLLSSYCIYDFPLLFDSM